MAARERKDRKAGDWREDIFALCDRVREIAYAIHEFHAHGHMEKVYENALAHRLRKEGIDVQQQCPLTVRDEDGTAIGEYYADMLVDHRLIVELKAARTMAAEHSAQLLGYLRASGIEHGLLINFGSYKFQIKKYVLSAPVRPGAARLACIPFFAFLAFSCGQFLR